MLHNKSHLEGLLSSAVQYQYVFCAFTDKLFLLGGCYHILFASFSGKQSLHFLGDIFELHGDVSGDLLIAVYYIFIHWLIIQPPPKCKPSAASRERTVLSLSVYVRAQAFTLDSHSNEQVVQNWPSTLCGIASESFEVEHQAHFRARSRRPCSNLFSRPLKMRRQRWREAVTVCFCPETKWGRRGMAGGWTRELIDGQTAAGGKGS